MGVIMSTRVSFMKKAERTAEKRMRKKRRLRGPRDARRRAWPASVKKPARRRFALKTIMEKRSTTVFASTAP